MKSSSDFLPYGGMIFWGEVPQDPFLGAAQSGVVVLCRLFFCFGLYVSVRGLLVPR